MTGVVELWPAPVAPGPVEATVAVPGSKSMTNRALVLAGLADGPARIENVLEARDTSLMAAGLTALGVGITGRGSARWTVTPGPLTGPAAVDVGNAGTVMRFLPPVATLADGEVAFDGDPRARQRPLGPVLAALQHLVRRSTTAGVGASRSWCAVAARWPAARSPSTPRRRRSS